MNLTHLSLTNFRNYTRLELDFPRKNIIFVGANAQGKTSILEAIYYLATLTAFHADNDRQLINIFTLQAPLSVARIVADFYRGEKKHHLEIRIILQEKNGFQEGILRKEILLDGVKRKSHEVVGIFNAVLFLPQMLSVVDGAPENRRRYLNLLLAQVISGYSAQLTLYHKTIIQRNALLKRLGESGGDVNQLAFWDGQLSESGAKIIIARIQAIQELGKITARIHQSLSGQKEILRMDYHPSFDPLLQPKSQYTLLLDAPFDRSGITYEEIKARFAERLQKERSKDIKRGATSIGPHRDDFCIRANGLELSKYGSRGQIRTAMLSMKTAEMLWMKEKTMEYPVLLFDEVLAELDKERRTELIESISLSEQVLLTTTDISLFNEKFIHNAEIWQIQQGRLSSYRESIDHNVI